MILLDKYYALEKADNQYQLGIIDEQTKISIIKFLNSLPSAQPEIIYCKKCKHWTETCGDEQWGLGDCDVFEKHLVMCNGYCAWAEGREV